MNEEEKYNVHQIVTTYPLYVLKEALNINNNEANIAQFRKRYGLKVIEQSLKEYFDPNNVKDRLTILKGSVDKEYTVRVNFDGQYGMEEELAKLFESALVDNGFLLNTIELINE